MIVLISSIISSALYRIGGAGKEEIPFANSQYRDIGCPAVLLITLSFMFGISWQVVLSAALVLLFIRTYHDYTGQDNMYLHGLFMGLSLIPLHWVGVSWVAIAVYSLVLACLMGLLNTICTRVRVPFSVWVEELFRGFLLIYALKILRLL